MKDLIKKLRYQFGLEGYSFSEPKLFGTELPWWVGLIILFFLSYFGLIAFGGEYPY